MKGRPNGARSVLRRSPRGARVVLRRRQGTYSREASTLSFTRTGGGGEGFPYLLGPGTISGDGDTISLLYGDEGPGSDQIQATFRR